MTPSRLPPAFLNHFFACSNEVVAGESLIALADFRFFVANFSSAIRRSCSGAFRSDLPASFSSRSKTTKVAGWSAANFCTQTGSGMEAQLQFVEGKTAIHINDEFAIEDKFFRGQLQKCDNDVREIAREGLARFRLQINVLATAKSEAAKAIPFRFILPTGADRNFINRLCFHWRERRCERGGHRGWSMRARREQTGCRPERSGGSRRSYSNTEGKVGNEMKIGEVRQR